MKIKIYIIGFLLVVGVSSAIEFPSSGNRNQFRQEVKDYVIGLYDDDRPIGRDRSRDQEIKSDQNDWESALAELIGDPGKYKWGPSTYALSVAKLRGKGNDPEISRAAIRHLLYFVGNGVELVDRGSGGNRSLSDANILVSSCIPELLEMESPDVLQEILKYIHSPESSKLGSISDATPKELAPALQKFGDLRNAEEALKVAAKLDSIGRVDVATDIRRAAERIRKDAAEKQTASSGGFNESSKDAPGSGDDGRGDPDKKTLWPWLAAGGALIAALAAYFRSKSARA